MARMTEEERQQFKARKAALIEVLFHKLFSKEKAEVLLADIARRAVRDEFRKLEVTSAHPQSEELPQ